MKQNCSIWFTNIYYQWSCYVFCDCSSCVCATDRDFHPVITSNFPAGPEWPMTKLQISEIKFSPQRVLVVNILYKKFCMFHPVSHYNDYNNYSTICTIIEVHKLSLYYIISGVWACRNVILPQTHLLRQWKGLFCTDKRKVSYVQCLAQLYTPPLNL